MIMSGYVVRCDSSVAKKIDGLGFIDEERGICEFTGKPDLSHWREIGVEFVVAKTTIYDRDTGEVFADVSDHIDRSYAKDLYENNINKDGMPFSRFFATIKR